MAYSANQSFSDNSIKEERSVLFIRQLLLGKAKVWIDTDDKQANIDGYIDLLDSSKRICGKITVQVKTVSAVHAGLNKYPCPTSLFAYAEVTPDNVFLLAVDHSCNKVLWKHISRELLNENRDKENQTTITLHFGSTEELRADSVDETLTTWLKICKSRIESLCREDEIVAENRKIKAILHEMPVNKTTLCNEDIAEIQNFSDEYNLLLDNEFRYIRTVLFPNIWKRGIAIYSYSNDQLEYSLFNIKKGELVAPIVQMPRCSIFELKYTHDYASFSCAENRLKKNPKLYTLSIIKKHVDDFIKKQRIIPFDEAFLIEYVHDFVEVNWRHLHLKKYSELDVHSLIQYFLTKHPNIDKMPVHLVSGGKSIYINTVYEAIKCLAGIGYTTIPYPYPPKGSYGNTGMVYDFYSPSTALEKSRIVILNTIRAYQNFIRSEFPLLADEMDAFYGGNLISVLVDYSDPRNKFIFHVYYFRSILPSNEKVITIEDIGDSKIIQENNLSLASDLFSKESVLFNGREFACFRGGGRTK